MQHAFPASLVALFLTPVPAPAPSNPRVPAGVEIELASGTPLEERAREQLERVLAAHDVERWLFTKRIRIEEDVIPHSHPVLTLSTSSLDDDVGLLADLVHEEFHWWTSSDPRTNDAIAEHRRLFPDAPDRAGGGARDRDSTWLHLVVCDLEYQGLAALVGEEAAREHVAGQGHYGWVYERVLADPRVRAVNARHGFLALLGGERPPLELETANGTLGELETAAELERLAAEHDLARFTFTPRVRVEAGVVPHSHPVLTVGTDGRGDDLLATFVHEQFHWMTSAMPLQVEAAVAAVRALFPEPPPASRGGARDDESTWLHLVVCDLELAALTELVGDERARAALRRMRHYEWIYARVLEDDRIRPINREHGFVLP